MAQLYAPAVFAVWDPSLTSGDLCGSGFFAQPVWSCIYNPNDGLVYAISMMVLHMQSQ
jgi:hypothetical protein